MVASFPAQGKEPCGLPGSSGCDLQRSPSEGLPVDSWLSEQRLPECWCKVPCGPLWEGKWLLFQAVAEMESQCLWARGKVCLRTSPPPALEHAGRSIPSPVPPPQVSQTFLSLPFRKTDLAPGPCSKGRFAQEAGRVCVCMQCSCPLLEQCLHTHKRFGGKVGKGTHKSRRGSGGLTQPNNPQSWLGRPKKPLAKFWWWLCSSIWAQREKTKDTSSDTEAAGWLQTRNAALLETHQVNTRSCSLTAINCHLCWFHLTLSGRVSQSQGKTQGKVSGQRWAGPVGFASFWWMSLSTPSTDVTYPRYKNRADSNPSKQANNSPLPEMKHTQANSVAFLPPVRGLRVVEIVTWVLIIY